MSVARAQRRVTGCGARPERAERSPLRRAHPDRGLGDARVEHRSDDGAAVAADVGGAQAANEDDARRRHPVEPAERWQARRPPRRRSRSRAAGSAPDRCRQLDQQGLVAGFAGPCRGQAAATLESTLRYGPWMDSSNNSENDGLLCRQSVNRDERARRMRPVDIDRLVRAADPCDDARPSAWRTRRDATHGQIGRASIRQPWPPVLQELCAAPMRDGGVFLVVLLEGLRRR